MNKVGDSQQEEEEKDQEDQAEKIPNPHEYVERSVPVGSRPRVDSSERRVEMGREDECKKEGRKRRNELSLTPS